MTNEQTIQQLHSLEFNAIPVSLQLVPHKSGKNWAYTNRPPQVAATVFGQDDVNCTFSIAKKGEKFSDSNAPACYLWLWDVDDTEAKMYAEDTDFGSDAIILIDPDGKPELISYKKANKLLIPQDVSDDSPSKQA
tara:strand:+ start:96 stop:500 length:405 start_codon:yes stop_codon:yes gene_type:complete